MSSPGKITARAALGVAAALTLVLAGCSTAADDNAGSGGGSTASIPEVEGSVEFNDPELKEIADEIAAQLEGQDVSGVNLAMVINNPSAFWTEGEVGMETAAEELGVSSEFQAPTGGGLNQQLSILDTLRSNNIGGYTLSAVDPKAVVGSVDAAQQAGINVVAIDSPLTGTAQPALYLGTPNFDAGKSAGETMATLLEGEGKVALLTGSLTAANAVQRMEGFKAGIEGTDIEIVDTLNDNADPAKALSNAETVLQANPDLAGIYSIWSYTGPAVGQAVTAAGKAGQVMVVSDDAEPKTVEYVESGAIQAMILQRPYQQGYMGVYLLTAMQVLGKDATMQILEPYLTDADGIDALNSGIGLVTNANLEEFLTGLEELGVPTE